VANAVTPQDLLSDKQRQGLAQRIVRRLVAGLKLLSARKPVAGFVPAGKDIVAQAGSHHGVRRPGLFRHGITRACAVVAFDNDIESSEAGLTSYSFNSAALAAAAVQFIAHPVVDAQRRRVVEVPGFVVSRMSG
jgi:hypothetical protein